MVETKQQNRSKKRESNKGKQNQNEENLIFNKIKRIL